VGIDFLGFLLLDDKTRSFARGGLKDMSRPELQNIMQPLLA